MTDKMDWAAVADEYKRQAGVLQMQAAEESYHRRSDLLDVLALASILTSRAIRAGLPKQDGGEE